MKLAMLASLLVLFAATGHAAGVDDYGAMVQRQSPVCLADPSLMRTAFLPGEGRPCCDGHVQCSQLLATTKIERPHRASHT